MASWALPAMAARLAAMASRTACVGWASSYFASSAVEASSASTMVTAGLALTPDEAKQLLAHQGHRAQATRPRRPST